MRITPKAQVADEKKIGEDEVPVAKASAIEPKSKRKQSTPTQNSLWDEEATEDLEMTGSLYGQI